jgi:hypothetical protein
MRRIFALFGFVVVLGLALALLWRVYQHHRAAEPFDSEEPAIVSGDTFRTAPVKFAA